MKEWETLRDRQKLTCHDDAAGCRAIETQFLCLIGMI